MKLLLTAKHWQLFILTYGIPIVLQILFMGFAFSSILTNTNQPPELLMYGSGVFFGALIIVALLSNGILMGWMWTVGTELQNYLPDAMTMKVGRFKVIFLLPFIYILILFCGGILLFLEINAGFEPSSAFPFLLIIPLHLLAMFCVFHSIYFIAKTIKSVELQRTAKLEEYLGEFFLVWFYVVGVWVLQPKINKWVAKTALE